MNEEPNTNQAKLNTIIDLFRNMPPELQQRALLSMWNLLVERGDIASPLPLINSIDEHLEDLKKRLREVYHLTTCMSGQILKLKPTKTKVESQN